MDNRSDKELEEFIARHRNKFDMYDLFRDHEEKFLLKLHCKFKNLKIRKSTKQNKKNLN